MAAGAAALPRLGTGESEGRDAGGAAGAGGGGGRHGGNEVDERGNDGGVGVPAVGAEVPRQHPLQPLPVAHAVRGHHLLHGRPEVAVRVGGVERHGHAVAEGRGGRRRVLGRLAGGGGGPMRGGLGRLPLEDGAGGRLRLEEEAVVGAEAADDGVGHVVGRGGLGLGGRAVVGRAVDTVRRARGGVGEGRLAGVKEEGRDGLGGGGRGPEGLGSWVLARGPHPCRWGGCWW
ncbi:hypothetical protein PAHAL_3G260900 [Panicum hallii]|jgi:hypothetical protein|uniref:Uncharacterized protein n=1 Tax=Panicum hallii TaxID=206008 RepID=A0A2T8KJH8_9POAL|nr:hypothetical protein PAHAL_3G260900 [Panicum hallii]